MLSGPIAEEVLLYEKAPMHPCRGPADAAADGLERRFAGRSRLRLDQIAAGNVATALDGAIRCRKRGLQATGKRRYGICRRAHRSTGGRRGACGAHHVGTANRGAG